MQFKIRDLMINIIPERKVAGSGGGVMMPTPTEPIPTPLTPFTPVIHVAAQRTIFEKIAVGAERGAKAGKLSPEFEALVNGAVMDAGSAAVAGAFQAGRGGGLMMPDPNCAGTSLETIPTPITPVVHKADLVLTADSLPLLKGYLQEALQAVEEVEQSFAPRDAADIEMLEGKLEGALKELRSLR